MARAREGATTSASSARAPAAAWPRTCSPRPARASCCSRRGRPGSRRTIRRCSCPSTRRRAAARLHEPKPFGEFDGCIGGWDIDGEPYTRAPGTHLRLVARAHARRPHESLGAHLPPLRPRRFPRQEPRRPRRRLADRLRRSRAVLRPASIELIGIFGSNEGLRNHPDGKSSRRRRSRAATSCWSSRRRDKLEHHLHSVAAVDHHEAAPRAPGVPLLRPVQPRLSGRRRTSRAPTCSSRRRCRRDGSRCITNAMAREVTVGPDGLADGRLVHRQDDRRGRARAREGRRARGERVRDARASCSTRSPTQFPNGLANSSGVVGKYLTDTTGAGVSRIHPDDGWTTSPHNRRWRGRHARLHAVVARQQEARLPARLSHRGGRRRSARRATASCGGIQRLSDRRRLRQAAQGRLSQVLRRVDRLRRPRRDDPERRLATASSIRTVVDRRHSRAALPLEVERPRVSTR